MACALVKVSVIAGVAAFCTAPAVLARTSIFERLSLPPVTSDGGSSRGVAWGDFDNDGDLDLFIAEGTEGIDNALRARGYDVRNRLFISAGDGFEAIRDGPIVNDEMVSAGAAAADFDLDGDLDIAVANWGGNDEDNSLYENHSQGEWIALALQGVRSNRMGIGAVASIEFEAGGETKRLYRRMLPQTAYASANEPVLHFGLGTAVRSVRIQIEWPTGNVDEFDAVEAGKRYLAVEGATVLQLLNLTEPSNG